jgi:pentatricopeptide repeat protein
LVKNALGGSTPRSVATPQLNRKLSTPDPAVESTAVQRLVEYFCVLSSVPRWETTADGSSNNNNSHLDPASPAASTTKRAQPSGRRRNRKERQTHVVADEKKCEEPASTSTSSKTTGNIHMPDDDAVADYTFGPQITARYPLTEHADNPLNPMISHFCYPTGDVIVPLTDYEMPRVHHFVLTNDKGRKIYGTCLTILEEYKPSEESPWGQRNVMVDDSQEGMEVSVDDRGKSLYLPKVLCLLSTWPYLTAFREHLAQLYRLATATNVMEAPIERYVLNLCQEIPAPPPGAYEIQVNILDSTIRFWAPPAKLPIAYVALPFGTLFECLDVEHVLTVWAALMTERKILLVSSQYSVLTVCCEILCSLLFPMRWSHLYVPLLPRMLCPMLGAPVPYLAGIARENWLYAQENLAEDTIVVDLDKNRVTFGSDTLPVPSAPARRWKKLRARLEESVGSLFWKARGLEADYQLLLKEKPHRRSLQGLRQKKVAAYRLDKLTASDHAFNLAYTPQSNEMDSWSEANHLNEAGQTRWDVVQEAFLRFLVDLLKKYRKYLILPSSTRTALGDRPSFDVVSFLAAQPSQGTPFLSEMCMSQHFDDWISRRLYSPGEPDLVFFDQSIDAKLNRSKLNMKKKETPFLQNARAHKILTTVAAIRPETSGLPRDVESPFVYKHWPSHFEGRLFHKPRPIPKMIAAEFDRQAVLVERFRAERKWDGDEDLGLQFRQEDFDSLPEVAAFTVFFFVYSALVGLDWQDYELKRREEEARRTADEVPSDEEDGNTQDRSQEVVLNADVSAKLVYVDPFDHCGSCPKESVNALTSTFNLFGEGAEEAYHRFFLETTKRMEELQRMLNPSIGTEQIAFLDTAAEEYEEAIEVANAQLDLGFEVIKSLSSRGLSADLDAFKSLMQACGRCRNTERALELTGLMKEQELAPDSEILSCFIAAFAAESEDEIEVAELESPSSEPISRTVSTDFKLPPSKDPFPWLTQCASTEKAQSSDDSVAMESVGSSNSSFVFGGGLADWLSHVRPKRLSQSKRRKRKTSKKLERNNSTRYRPVSRFVKTQLELGENLLDLLCPDLKIDTSSDACPHCSYCLSESETVLGWVPRDFQDYTTQCPKCHHRFVPNFSVSCSSPTFEGSQGKNSVLFCELLSPWVLRKALGHVINGETGILGMLDPEWRSGTDIRATLFWNLIVLCRRYRLPFTFLLQGSVQGRLILPRTPKEM